MIHCMDAETHGGAAQLRLPAAAPRHGVIGVIAEPQGVADADERAAEQGLDFNG